MKVHGYTFLIQSAVAKLSTEEFVLNELDA